MSRKIRLGIDVGGTNTDGVLLDSQLNVLAKVKVSTSQDISSGINAAIDQLLKQANLTGDQVSYAMLGTTQCTNAIVERKGLDRVGMIRLALPSGSSVPPLCGWSDSWQKLLGEHFYQAHGGYEYDGRLIAEVDKDEVLELCYAMRGKVDSIAICGVFSPVNSEQESTVAQWVKEALPDVKVSLSHQVGSLGILERENATILNAALQGTALKFVQGFCHALESHRITAQPYFGQNDGTLMNQEDAIKYPILTVACGPTNSIRGASHLTQLKGAIVIDVGGTTSDIGALTHGYPRESSSAVELGEVRTNFRMPDILALAIGGGTKVSFADGMVSIGPESVGHQLTSQALSFGGEQLTLTDIALSKQVMTWKGQADQRQISLDPALVETCYKDVIQQLEEGIDKMKTSAQDIPVILVGGGSAILPDHFQGASEVIRPEHFEVANAIGVALGEVSGQLDKVIAIPTPKRKAIISELETEAKMLAINAGASPDTVEMIEKIEVPLSYLRGGMCHIKYKAAGSLK
ncbi:hydantoinase/oxoprolinase N-terminal domain-containing protein [Vibrio astriarenae]